MNIDFSRIRPINGSCREGFEELCCQIARYMASVPGDSKFHRFRGAGGDGGVECVWILPNGAEWGYQAKLINELDKRQLTESFETAIRLHPKLTRYTICLPFNLTGPTGRKGKSQQEKFDEYVDEWKRLAEGKGLDIEIIYFGRKDIIDFLAKDAVGGYLKFWFNEDILNDSWFSSHLKDVFANASPRYTPELRVWVPTKKAFESFGHTEAWKKQVENQRKKISKKIRELIHIANDEQCMATEKELAPIVESLSSLRDETDGFLGYDFNPALSNKQILEKIDAAVAACEQYLDKAIPEFEEKHGKGTADSASFRQFQAEYMCSFPRQHIDTNREILRELGHLKSFFWDIETDLFSSSTMLLIGDPGVGKTHIICDTAQERMDCKVRSVVLLGQQFNGSEPWSQIRDLLGFPSNISRDQMLQMFNISGEITGYPLIIFIDALNESSTRHIWINNLKGMVERIKEYPWVRLCISCRTSYLDVTIPDSMGVPCVNHTGFEGVEYEAWTSFFKHYGLQSPSMPLLHPEFTNPLFLKVVCEALHEAGITVFPHDFVCFSRVVERLISEKNKKVATILDYTEKDNYVQIVLNELIKSLSCKGKNWLERNEARKLTELIWPGKTVSGSLFEVMIREGILFEDRVRDEKGNSCDCIRLGYDRMGDFLLAQSYLDDIDSTSIKKAFTKDGRLNFLINPLKNIELNKGLIEMLSILIPEKYSYELISLVDSSLKDNELLLKAFLESLPWRDSSAIFSDTFDICRHCLNTKETFQDCMESILTVSIRPGFGMNASWFHSEIVYMSMGRRDQWWVPFLHLTYGTHQSMDRILRWALSVDLTNISDGVLELWATQLLWFCASSDRRVRDFATKSLVRIVESRIKLLRNLLNRFISVNDEYVLERCLAITYGCLIRSPDNSVLGNIAESIDEYFFDGGNLPENALVRDYIYLIMNLANINSVLPKGTVIGKFTPPFKSSWPLVSLPEEEIESKREEFREKYPKLLFSCRNDDFATYTVSPFISKYDGIDLKEATRWIFSHIIKDIGYNERLHADFDGHLLYKYGGGRSKPVWTERIGKKYQWIAFYRLIGRVSDNLQRKKSHWYDDYEEKMPLQALHERNIDPTFYKKDILDEDQEKSYVMPSFNFQKEQLSDKQWMDESRFPDSSLLLSTRDSKWYALKGFYEWNSEKIDYNEDQESKYPYRTVWLHLNSCLIDKRFLKGNFEKIMSHNFCGSDLPRGFSFYHIFLGEYPWIIPELKLDSELRGFDFELIPCVNTINHESEWDCYQKLDFNVMVPSEIFFKNSNLSWDLNFGYSDDSNRPIFKYSISKAKEVPSVLLVNQDYLKEFLLKTDFVLLWIITSEKQIIAQYKSSGFGWRTYSRVYLFDGKAMHSGNIISERKGGE